MYDIIITNNPSWFRNWLLERLRYQNAAGCRQRL